MVQSAAEAAGRGGGGYTQGGGQSAEESASRVGGGHAQAGGQQGLAHAAQLLQSGALSAEQVIVSSVSSDSGVR